MSDATKGILQGLKNIGGINQDFKKININDIDIKNNVRNEYNIDELAENIKIQGVQVPIKVIKNDNDRYDILFGHRRFLANKKCYEEEKNEKFLYIPSIIDTPKTEEEIIEIQVVENLDREDLTDIEKSEAISKYKEITGKTNGEIAKRFGKKEKWIRDILDAKTIINKINEVKKSLLTTNNNKMDENAKSLLTTNDNKLNKNLESLLTTNSDKLDENLKSLLTTNNEFNKIPISVIVETKGLAPVAQKEILERVKNKNLTQAEVRKIKKEIKNNAIDVQSAIKKIKEEKNSKNNNGIKIVIGKKNYILKKRKIDTELIKNLNCDEDIKNIIFDLIKQINN